LLSEVKMSRRRAWFLAAIVTASIVSLVLALGANFGYFGFGRTEQTSASAPLNVERPQAYGVSSLSQQSQEGQVTGSDQDGSAEKHGERQERRPHEGKNKTGSEREHEEEEDD